MYPRRKQKKKKKKSKYENGDVDILWYFERHKAKDKQMPLVNTEMPWNVLAR